MNNTQELNLIKLAQKGDEKAIDKLFENYKHLVVSLARKYYLVGGENEDLVQEGMLGFFKAINTFDEEKNEFLTYAKTLINHQIINAIKKSESGNARFLNDSMALNNQGEVTFENDEKVFGVPSSSWLPENEFLSYEGYSNLVLNAKKMLSNYESNVFDLYLQGYDYDDIIKQLNTNYKSVDNALNRIKTKLKSLKRED